MRPSLVTLLTSSAGVGAGLTEFPRLVRHGQERLRNMPKRMRNLLEPGTGDKVSRGQVSNPPGLGQLQERLLLMSCGSPVVDNRVLKPCRTQTVDRSSHASSVVEYANGDRSYSCHLQ
jgi:hypothetical protein